jgi:hypothetical protein
VKFYERKRRRKSKDFSLEKLVWRIFEAHYMIRKYRHDGERVEMV